MPRRSEKAKVNMILVQPETLYNKSDMRASLLQRKEATWSGRPNGCVPPCATKRWTVEKIVKEVASGMNDNRPKLRKLLASRPSRVVVEHKDRLTRFGFGYFEQLLPMLGCELVVINRDAEEKDDLLKDLVSVIASFCCRLYGLRRGRQKAKRMKAPL